MTVFHSVLFDDEQSRGGFPNRQAIVLQLETIIEASPIEHLYFSCNHRDDDEEIRPYRTIYYRVMNYSVVLPVNEKNLLSQTHLSGSSLSPFCFVIR